MMEWGWLKVWKSSSEILKRIPTPGEKENFRFPEAKWKDEFLHRATENGTPFAKSETTLSIRVFDPSGLARERPVWADFFPKDGFADTVIE